MKWDYPTSAEGLRVRFIGMEYKRESHHQSLESRWIAVSDSLEEVKTQLVAYLLLGLGWPGAQIDIYDRQGGKYLEKRP